MTKLESNLKSIKSWDVSSYKCKNWNVITIYLVIITVIIEIILKIVVMFMNKDKNK